MKEMEEEIVQIDLAELERLEQEDLELDSLTKLDMKYHNTINGGVMFIYFRPSMPAEQIMDNIYKIEEIINRYSEKRISVVPYFDGLDKVVMVSTKHMALKGWVYVGDKTND